MTTFLPKDNLQNYNGWTLPPYCNHFHSSIGKNMSNSYQNKCDRDVFKSTPNKNVAIDIGGNVGLMARRYAGVFNQVHTFEPVLENCSCLFYNTEDLDNVTVHHLGLGEEEKQEEIFLPKSINTCGSWSIVDFKDNTEEKRSEIIEIKTLDSFNLEPDFIKIDIQGYEISVLKGASKTLEKFKPTLLIETISAGKDISLDIGKFLAQFGYKQIKRHNKDRIYKA